MKLLVIEDERLIARFLLKGLRARGYHVDHVETGTEALQRISEGGYDLVLLDLGLPDLDGLDVLSALRKIESRLPVIVLTARAHDREEGLRRGADEYLVKPVAFAHLLESVRALA